MCLHLTGSCSFNRHSLTIEACDMTHSFVCAMMQRRDFCLFLSISCVHAYSFTCTSFHISVTHISRTQWVLYVCCILSLCEGVSPQSLRCLVQVKDPSKCISVSKFVTICRWCGRGRTGTVTTFKNKLSLCA